tara:strand:- start:607 stop:768 length:162 start_codon:yes stop_codon:yes gene_type:complete
MLQRVKWAAAKAAGKARKQRAFDDGTRTAAESTPFVVRSLRGHVQQPTAVSGW